MEKNNHDCRKNCTDASPCNKRSHCEDRCRFCGTCHDHHCTSGAEPLKEHQPHPEEKPAELIIYDWIINSCGTQLFASDSVYDLLGWMPSEIEGSDAFSRVPAIHREKAFLDFQRAVRDGRPARVTVERADGLYEEIIYTVQEVRHRNTGAVLAYKGRSVLAVHFHPKHCHALIKKN